LADLLSADDCQQSNTQRAAGQAHLPGRRRRRLAGAERPACRFGRDAAHRRTVLRLPPAAKPDLGSRIVRAWSIVPAAVNERHVGAELLEAGPPPSDPLADKGFNGAAFAAGQAAVRRAGPGFAAKPS
jgi:hypothetical protein